MNTIRVSMLAVLATCAGATDIQQRAHDLGVNSDDVSKVQAIVDGTKPLLSAMWKEMGNPVGFLEPRLQAVYVSIDDTGCGRIETGNAFYCKAENTIYYDPLLLASIMKRVGEAAGSDGSYAVAAILEHELGHAVAWRREWVATRLSMIGGGFTSYEREEYADCAAGAMTARAIQTRWIGDAQAKEASLMFGQLGDVGVVFEDAHGDGPTRMRNFAQGYQGGAGGIGFCKLETFETRLSKQLDPVPSCDAYGREFGIMAEARGRATGVCK